MKIGVLSQWFDPEPGPASLPGVYAREFVKQGHSVNVLTGFPNYPEGRLYAGYKMRPWLRELHDEVRVTRVPLYPNHSSSTLGRILNYASFGLSASLLSGAALRSADALWVYNSPVTVAAPMLTHSRWGRTPIFLHVQDLWPDSLVESGMFPKGWVGEQAERAVSAIVRLTERRSAVIGVISKSVRELLLDRNPSLDPSKIVYVPNPTNEQLFCPAAETRESNGILQGSGIVEVMYAGAIGEVQGLDTLMAAAMLIRGRTDIRITLVGDGIGRSRLERLAKREGLKNVRFTGRVTQDEVPRLIAGADVQIVSLASNPFLSHTTPSKISSLLASGVPILGQIEGDGANLLRESGAALVVRSGAVQEMADGIISLADIGHAARIKMGSSGRSFYEKHLSARAAAAEITSALIRAGAGG